MLSVDGESWPYVGEIRFEMGTAIVRYSVEGHPEIESIAAQFGPLGHGGTVLVRPPGGELREFDLSARARE